MIAALAGSLGFEYGSAWSLDEDSGLLRCSTTWSEEGSEAPAMDTAVQVLTFERGEGRLGRAWATGTPSWSPDVTAERDFTRHDAAVAEGFRGSVLMPIAHGGEFIGDDRAVQPRGAACSTRS